MWKSLQSRCTSSRVVNFCILRSLLLRGHNLVLVLILTSGCAVGGKSVSIDSNSRIPFFGLELFQRSPKSSGPPLHSIRRKSTSTVRIETLSLAPIRNKKEVEKTISSESPQENRLPTPESQTFPRTDVNLTSAGLREITDTEIDFR